MFFIGITRILSALAFAGLLFLSVGASAQTFPAKPVTIIVPLGPGGAGDAITRLLAPHLSRLLGQPVVIENRPGAASAIGWAATARSAPDGHTITLSGFNISSIKLTNPEIEGDPMVDLTPITRFANYYTVLSVPVSSPAKTLQELAAQSRIKPVFYAVFGQDVRPMMVGRHAKADFQAVDYRAADKMVADLLSGEVGFAMMNIGGMLPHIRANKVRPLMVSAMRRQAALPDVPSLSEVLPGLELPGLWYGFHAPAKTPRAVIERLNRDLVAAIRAPDVMERLGQLGYEVATESPDAFRDFIAKEAAINARAVRDFGMLPAK